MYGTGGYADTSQRIGTAVEEAVAQNRVRTDRMRATEDRNRKIESENYAMEQLKMKEYSGLVIPQNSPYNDIENHFQEAAGHIPDAYAAVENSKLSIKEKGRAKANLMQEVGSLKAARQSIINQGNIYQKAINDGTLSGYNSMTTRDYMNTLITPDNGLRVNMEKNNLALQGKTINGDNIDIPLRQVDQHAPRVLLKSQNPRDAFKVLNKEAYSQGLYTSNNPDLIDKYKDNFTGVVDSLGSQGSKAMAVDWLGFSPNQVDAYELEVNNENGGYTPMATKQDPNPDSYANRLEYEMENRYVQMGKDTFLESEKLRTLQQIRSAQLKGVNQKLNTASNSGERINPEIYENLFNSIYNPNQGPKNLGSQDVISQNLLPGSNTFNVTEGMQSAMTGLGIGAVTRYEEGKEGLNGYEIPKSGKDGKKVFVKASEANPESIFKGILSAKGLKDSDILNIYNLFMQPQQDNTLQDFTKNIIK